MPLRPLGNDSFLPCLSPDLDGVQLFRIHCQAAAVVRLCLRTAPLVFSSRASKGATSAPGEWSFFALPAPGFRWCAAVSDPLPSGCRWGCVTFFFAHVPGLSSSPVGVPKAPLRPLATALPEFGFRWCLAVSDPLPKGGPCAFVEVRLPHVFCLRTGALFFSCRGSKGATSAPGEWSFFALPVRLSRLGCVTVFVYVLGLFSFSLGVPKVPLRPLATNRFLLRVSSDLGGVSLFRIHCQKRVPVCVCVFCFAWARMVFGCFGSSAKGLPFCVCAG